MELVDMWHQQTQQRYSDDADRQAEFERFKKTQGYQECLQTGKELAGANVDGILDSMGENGLVYPFATNESEGDDTEQDRENKRAYRIYIAHCLWNLAMNHDATAIGEIAMEQLHAYIMREAERFVEDNWEQWK